MKPVSALLTFLLAFLISPTTAFWRMPCPGRLVDERADPLVSPGVVSGHVHSIAGGSGFSFNMTYEDARASSCSSCPIKADLSNYWVPHLYYRAENGTFIDVPVSGDGDGNLGGITVYYLQRPGANNDALQAFPEGFRMLAGDPFRRNYTGDFAAQAISYACLNYDGPATAETNGFPDNNCPDGLRAQVFFPSCWDGVNLDSANHQSHVSYPASGAYNDGVCPDSHPVHLISIFYEIIFQTNLFADMWWGDEQPFVFAMGDPTGYGFHGDFINGWDVDILQYAVDNCLNDSGLISDCLAANGSEYFDLFTTAESSFCTLPAFVDETVTGVLDRLPGCNDVTWGPEEASVQTCDETSVITDAVLANYYTDLTQTLGWEYFGCAFDNVTVRTLDGSNTSDDDMTVEACVSYCSEAGYSYAGLEYSTQCYCGDSIAAGNDPIQGVVGGCLFACGGNSTQMCGGSDALSVYHNCEGSSTCTNADIGVIEGAASVAAGSTATSIVASGTAASGSATSGDATSGTASSATAFLTSFQTSSQTTATSATTALPTGGIEDFVDSTVVQVVVTETVVVAGPTVTVTVTA